MKLCGLERLVRAAFGAATIAMGMQGARAQPVPLVQELSAEAFLDTIGINTHMSAADTGPTGTSYGNVDAVIRELAFIGVHHARDILLIGKNLGKIEMIHEKLGIGFDLVYDYYGVDGGSSTIANALSNVEHDAAFIEAIEGPNEPDQFGLHYNGLTRAPAVMAAQRALYQAVKGDPKLSSIPVFCTAFSYPAGGLAAVIGNLAPYCDYSASHDYVENRSTGKYLTFDYLQRWTTYPLSFAPGRPLVITEGGWSTCPPDEQGVSESAQAKYTLTYLLDAALLGIKRTYLYDLSDDGQDPDFKDSVNHYGLFRFDGTAKPAATMLARVRSILGAGQPSPGHLSFQVKGLPSTGHQLLLHRADGSFALALWTEAYLWSRFEHADLRSPVTPVTVQFDSPISSVTIEDPILDSPGNPLSLDGHKVVVSIPDHPVFLLIEPTQRR
jgi:serralysin